MKRLDGDTVTLVTVGEGGRMESKGLNRTLAEALAKVARESGKFTKVEVKDERAG